MSVDGKWGAALHAFQGALENGVREEVCAPAAPADEMVVMPAVAQNELVAAGALAQVDGVQQSELDEQAERSVDARGAGTPPQAVGNLVGDHAATTIGEQLDDSLSRAA